MDVHSRTQLFNHVNVHGCTHECSVGGWLSLSKEGLNLVVDLSLLLMAAVKLTDTCVKNIL